jgi:hypothetical protein
VSTTYSHVWRAADTDFPCNLTGRKGPDANGEVYVEISRDGGLTYVPQGQLVTFASWKAEQSKATKKTPQPPNDACVTAALRYAERGWRVFPVPFGTKKSYKSGERSGGRAWGMTCDPMEIEGDFEQWPDAGVGIPTGKVNAIFVVETDTIAGHNVDGLASLKALETEHGRLPKTLTAKSPTGSIHRYFAWPSTSDIDIRNSDSKLGPGIDIRANGGMVLAPPTRTPKGVYRWMNNFPIADAPLWLIKLIEKGSRPQRAPSAPSNGARRPVTDEQLREVMECIPNDDGTSWEDWNRVGMALFAATNGSWLGAELFDQWSEKNDKYDDETTEAKWEAYSTSPPTSIGVGTLFYLANAAQFEAEMEAIAALEAQGKWDRPPVEDAFPDDLENDDDENADAPPIDFWKAIDAPELPFGLLPPRVEKFVLANAKALGADNGGLAGASIAALAAAIPDSVKLQVQAKGRKWQIAARIWVALVGDPSTKKTPIIKAALAALERHDHRRRQEYAFLKSLWDAQTKREKAEALAAGRKPPDHNRLIIGDITAEAAGEIIMTSPNGVLACHDELSGFFAQMERYNPKGSDRTFWLQARNGGPFSVDRITRGSNYIPNLSVTLIGGIQPEPMRKVAAGASDDGLIQRLTPIMLRPAEMTDDDVNTEAADKDFADLIDTLLDLSPSVLRFDAGAQTIRRDLEFEHHECVRSWEPINKKLSSAFGKQDGYFAELCLIWHCAENAGQDPLPEVVTEDTTRRAAEFMRTFLRPHLVAFYAGLLDLSDEHDRLKAIAGYILAHKPKTMNSREVQKAVRSMRKLLAREVTAIMEQLEAFGWLFRHPPPRYGALPVWKINPAVHVQFAERAKEETVRRARDRAAIIKGATAQSVSR